MKSFLLLFFSLLSAYCITGCSKSSQCQQLVEIEELIESYPDSAGIEIEKISYDALDGDDQPYYILLRTIIDAKQGKPVTKESEIGLAYKYYSDKVENATCTRIDGVRFSKSAMYMGDWYALCDSVKSCEDTYREAIRYAERFNDSHTTYCALSRLAKRVVYSNSGEALRLIEKAIGVYESNPDGDMNYIYLLNDAANYSFVVAHYSDRDYTKALSYAERELRYAESKNLPQGVYQAHSFYVNLYNNTGQYQEALKHAKQVKTQGDDTEPSMIVRTVLAECYMNCDSLVQARENYRAALASSHAKTRYIASLGMAQVMLRFNETDSAKIYYNLALEYNESVYFSALEAKDAYYQDSMIKELEKEKIHNKSLNRMRLFWGASLIFVLITLILSREFIMRMKRQRQRHINSLYAKKHELEMHIVDKLHFRREKELLQEKTNQQEHIVRFLQNYILNRQEFVRKISEGKDKRLVFTQKEWMDIESVLNDIDDNRISRIRSKIPELTEDDIQLCILVLLHMSNSIIGSFYCISVSAVQHRKQKLKKEMFGVKDPHIQLEQVILSV